MNLATHRPSRFQRTPICLWVLGPLLFLLFTACDSSEITTRPTEWQTLSIAPTRMDFEKGNGVDYWYVRWDEGANLAFIGYSDYLGDNKGVYRIDLKENAWSELQHEEAFSYELCNRLAKLPAGLEAASTLPVEVIAKGRVSRIPSHFRWGFTRGRGGRWPIHLDREETFTGALVVRLKDAAKSVLIAQQLHQVVPSDPLKRLSISPDGRYLIHVDGCLGGSNHIYLFDLRLNSGIRPAQARPTS